MNKLVMVGCLNFLLFISFSVFGESFETVADLNDKCRKAISENPTIEEVVMATSCVEYIYGAANVIYLTKMFCPKNFISKGEMVQIFLDWVATHPGQLSDPAAAGIIYAMSEAWPCS